MKHGALLREPTQKANANFPAALRRNTFLAARVSARKCYHLTNARELVTILTFPFRPFRRQCSSGCHTPFGVIRFSHVRPLGGLRTFAGKCPHKSHAAAGRCCANYFRDSATLRGGLPAGPSGRAEKLESWRSGCHLDFEVSDGRASSVRRRSRPQSRFSVGRDDLVFDLAF